MTPVRTAQVCILVLLFCLPASAGVTQIQITSRTSFASGATFGSVGAYEVIQGTVYFTVNPSDSHDSVIFDINHAPVDSNGLVDFSANFYILKPVNMANSNHEILYDVNNRGGKLVLQLMDDIPDSANINNPSTLADVGNQFLLLQGYTIVWVGWEGDLVPGPDLLLAQLPVATQNGQPITGSSITEFTDTTVTTTMPLSGSSLIESYPSISTNQTTAGAQLVMRPSDSPRPSGPGIPAGTVIPNSQWSFSNCSTPSTTDICYPAGFQTNMVYQLIYTAENPIIMGLGYATTRDFVSFLRYATQDTLGDPNPLAGDINYALAFGASQSGRYLRDYLYQGFNEDEQGNKVFDGVFIHVAGANKLPLNFRFADANPYSLQHSERFVPSDNFPRSYGVLTDPVTGTTDGILKRPSSDPKVFHTITSTEYWQYRNSLVDTNDSGTADIPNPSNVREYLLAGTAHIHSVDDTLGYGACQQLVNITTNGGLLRALLLDLDQWVRNGTAPPPSAVPSIAAGTLVTSDQASTGFPSIPGVTYNGLFNGSGEENFGPDVTGNSGVIDPGYLDPIPLSTQQVLVPKVNDLGIDLGGIQEPTVADPIDTLTGWNLRSSSFTDGDVCDLEGMTIPLETTLAERLDAGDPRPSLQELYGDHTGYVNAITASSDSLEAQGFLLPQDVTQFIQNASNSSVLIPAPPPILLSLTPSQSMVSGGTPVTETANLSTVAPSGGAVVTLSTSDNTLLSIPPNVTVPAGSYNATFAVNTTPVSSQTTATVTGSYGGAAQNASFTVQPPAAPYVSLSPATVIGGSPSQGTVVLTSAAPAGGTTVTLSSNSAVATVPSSVTVSSGQTMATFNVTTNTVLSTTTVTISATFGTATRTALLVVQPVGGGNQPTFIQGAANYGGSVNAISATFGSNVGAGHLLVVAVGYSGGSTNDTSVTFTISDTLGNTWISAIGPVRWTSGNGVAQIFYVPSSLGGADTVTVTPSIGSANFLDLYIHEYSGTSVSFPLDVTASNYGTGTTLSSGSASTTTSNELVFGYCLVGNSAVAGTGFTAREALDGNVSEDEVVNAVGSYSATFSQPAGGNWIALMATFKTTSGTSSPSISAVTLNPSTVVGGNSSQGTVTLNGAAPSGGAAVTVSSGNTSVATVTPGTVNIGAGGTSGTFTVNTSTVTAPTQVTITGSYNGTATGNLVVNSTSGGSSVFVQGAANNGSSVNSVSAAFSSSVGAGHLLVAAVGYSDNSTNIGNVTFTVTDSEGNMWVSALNPVRRSGHGVAQIFYVKSSLGGAETVTVTPSIGNASFLELYVHEYSGTDTSGPLDVTANGQGSSTTPSSGAGATSGSNELIFGYALLTHTGAAGTGFTARETLEGDVSEDELALSSGSYSATFSQPSTGQWIALMAAFKMSSGTSSPSISAVTLNPSTVVGGNSSQGTVTLNGGAPSGGAAVTVSSGNTSVATVTPGTVNIGAGGTSGTFTVNTSTVTAPTQVTITGSYNGTATGNLVVNSTSGGSPVFVQGAANNGSSVNSVSAAFSSSVGAGHLLVAAVGYSDNSTNIGNVTFTVTDSEGNMWVSALNPVRRSGHGVAQIFYVKSSLGGAETVTVTPSIGNASFLELYVHEYSGTDTSGPLDVTANGQGSSTTPSSGAGATSGSNELIFGYALLTHTGAAGTGFTARETLEGDVSEDELALSSGSYSATFSQPSTGQWIALMAAFKMSSGTSSPSISAVTLNPSTVVGGNSSQGTVTLNGGAPSGGAAVTVSSGNTSVATVTPGTVNIGAGGTSGTFTVNTSTVTAPTQVTITGSYNGTAQGNLVVNSTSGGSPVFVQGAANNGSSVNSVSAAFSSSVGAGHLLVAAVGYSDNSTNIGNVTFTVTDSEGNMWVSALNPVRRSGHGVAQIFYVKSSLGGAETVTVTPSIGNASFLELYVHEYSGTDTSGPLDVTANGQGSSTTPSSGAGATSGSNELIFGYALLTHTGAAGTGFTARETLGGDVSEDELALSSGSYSATFSQPSTGQWIALMAAFK